MNIEKSFAMIEIDIAKGWVVVDEGDGRREYRIGTPEAFSIISKVWLRCGWDNKYVYSFTWMGRPIIQLPDDMIRIQEVLYSVKPDVIIETGIAHGGSLVYYASFCKAISKGRVIGVDIEIRPHNREAIEAHELFPYITLIEGNSIEPDIFKRVSALVEGGEKVIVLLDSCHTKEHVLGELNLYASLVSVGSYIVAMDGIKKDLVGAPRSQPDWGWNNPERAAIEFVQSNPDFIIEEPRFPFNEGSVIERVTYCPNAFIRRIK
jgi:cephalosporin hydroxylase